MKNWKKLAEKMLKNMDRQKWIVCILIGVLLLVIAIPVDSKKQDAPYETKTIEPKIRGVCVVAEGASDNRTKVAIYEAIQALFSVDAHKISIVEMGSQEGT